MRDLREKDLIHVSPAMQARMFLIVQAIGKEAQRRGYSIIPAKSWRQTFQFLIGEDMFGFDIKEATKSGDAEQAGKQFRTKNSWLASNLRNGRVPNGQLVISWLGQNPIWRDRSGVPIELQLASVMLTVETAAAGRRAARDRRVEEDKARLIRRDEALPAARQRYRDEVNFQRLQSHAAASEAFEQLQRYCDRLAVAVDELKDEAVRAEAERWLAFARQKLPTLDPLSSPPNLRYVEPTGHLYELEKFLPPELRQLGYRR